MTHNLASGSASGSFDAADLWLATLKAAGRRPATIDTYGQAVTKLRTWRTADPANLETLTKLEARAFVRWLQENYQPGGVSIRVRALRGFYNWLVADEIIAANPFANLRISVPKEAQTTADEEQINAMLEHAKRSGRNARRDLAMLAILVDTGCRKGEIAALTVDNIDLTNGTVTFPISKTTARTVPLTDRAVAALARYLRVRGTGRGSLWSVTEPYQLIRQVVRRHSDNTLTPHALRRAFAVSWLLRGGSETSLMRLAGWSSLAMIRTYTQASADVIASDEFKRLMG